MNNALNICISSFETMQNASSRAVDTASISAARMELNKASIAMDSVEKNIREADAAQKQLNNDMRQGQAAAGGLVGEIKNIVTGIAAAVGITKTIKLSDTVAQTTARVDLMNDSMQTTAQLQEMIFASAEDSRGSYLGTAAAVAQLGSQAKGAFSNNAELIAFSEQLNKNFIIAGTAQEGIAASTLQLTQGMASGVLRGEELNSVFENAQPIIQHIADYLKVDVGHIREMAQEGQITASIVKNALLSAAEQTNAKFAKMPKTFGQIWTSVENHGIRAFQPVLTAINNVANSKRFERLVNGVINGMYTLSGIAETTFNIMSSGAALVADNWSLIEPVVLGVAAAYIAYNGAAMISSGITAVQNARNWLLVESTIAQTGATIAAAYAQGGLNAALYACPLSWIIIAIIALIAIFYLAVAAVNKFAGTSLSATGLIVGSFYFAGAAIGNVVIAMVNLIIDTFGVMWNFIATFVEFFANVWDDPIGSIVRLFADMANTILGILSGIASAVDTIFGSKLTSAVEGWRKSLKGAVNEKFGEGAYKAQRLRVDTSTMHINRIDYGQAWDKGYNLGNDVANKFKLSLGSNGLDKDVARNIEDTAANTSKMKDSMDITAEDLKYLRDIAEQEVINRFTTAEIKVDMGGIHNSVSSNNDLDGMMTYLKDTLIETMQTAAEGVHE
jgi:tape measure domain-containing protein